MTPPDEPRNLPEDYLRENREANQPAQPAQPAQPWPQQNPYEPTSPYPQQGAYGQPPRGYVGPGYGQAPPVPGYAYGGPVTAPPHPSAMTAMVLGIIGLGGIMFCAGLTLVLSPFAWAIGRKAVREIDASPGTHSGRDQAKGGEIMGIIGTVLLALGVIAVTLLIIGIVAATDSDFDQSPVSPVDPSVQTDRS
ncbi:DUF4190 domain-containing protein [Nocardioides sp. LHG3406-4]|uniref:DUF4190 domain-containing protein n=1 Tax=Nocardioides sp. LHG3406-4 TaxID=2804575 RepID=UPI003CF11A2C